MEIFLGIFIAKLTSPVLVVVGVVSAFFFRKIVKGYWALVPSAILAAIVDEAVLVGLQSYRNFGDYGSIYVGFLVGLFFAFFGYRLSIKLEKKRASS